VQVSADARWAARNEREPERSAAYRQQAWQAPQAAAPLRRVRRPRTSTLGRSDRRRGGRVVPPAGHRACSQLDTLRPGDAAAVPPARPDGARGRLLLRPKKIEDALVSTAEDRCGTDPRHRGVARAIPSSRPRSTSASSPRARTTGRSDDPRCASAPAHAASVTSRSSRHAHTSGTAAGAPTECPGAGIRRSLPRSAGTTGRDPVRSGPACAIRTDVALPRIPRVMCARIGHVDTGGLRPATGEELG
jgi:hypothetical protein